MVQNTSVPKQIKKYLAEKKMTQYKLAQELGIPPQTITRWIKTGRINQIYLQMLKSKGVIS
ncbi:MAG: helix-turn-helix transcriptional regulator [Candidatus Omnitrophica bacterium]|nr:helix-turn-helix transcriptional regulator [Candidatus Omnitrophota bacterium]